MAASIGIARHEKYVVDRASKEGAELNTRAKFGGGKDGDRRRLCEVASPVHDVQPIDHPHFVGIGNAHEGIADMTEQVGIQHRQLGTRLVPASTINDDGLPNLALCAAKRRVHEIQSGAPSSRFVNVEVAESGVVIPGTSVQHLDIHDRTSDLQRDFETAASGPPVIHRDNRVVGRHVVFGLGIENIDRPNRPLAIEDLTQGIEVRGRHWTVHAIVHVDDDHLTSTKVPIDHVGNTVRSRIPGGAAKVADIFQKRVALGHCRPTGRRNAHQGAKGQSFDCLSAHDSYLYANAL